MSHEEFVTDDTKMKVMCFVQMGITQGRIAQHLGISEPTLRKYYAHELEHGRETLQTLVMGKLMKKVLEDENTSCIIFAAKTICGLKETMGHEFVKPVMVIKPPDNLGPPPPAHGEDDK